MMIRMMKPILCLCLSLFVGMQAFAREVELRSPDGKLCVTVDDKFFSVKPDTVKDFFSENVLAKV